MVNICANNHLNPSTKYRDDVSCKTDSQTADPNTQCLSLPTAGGGSIKTNINQQMQIQYMKYMFTISKQNRKVTVLFKY